MNKIGFILGLPWLIACEIMGPDPDSAWKVLLALPFIGLGFVFMWIFTIAGTAIVIGMIMFPFWAIDYLELM